MLTRRSMDILTATAWAASGAFVLAFLWAASPARNAPGPEASTGMAALESALALFAIALICAGVAAILCQWIAVAAYAVRRGHWSWLAACLIFSLIGSTIAYLSLRRQWDPRW